MNHKPLATFWIEIPVPAEKGSYGCNVTADELARIFSNLPESFKVAAFPDFRFRAW